MRRFYSQELGGTVEVVSSPNNPSEEGKITVEVLTNGKASFPEIITPQGYEILFVGDSSHLWDEDIEFTPNELGRQEGAISAYDLFRYQNCYNTEPIDFVNRFSNRQWESVLIVHVYYNEDDWGLQIYGKPRE